MPPWRKLELVAGMNRMVRTLALQGLRRRFPNASAPEVHRRLAEHLFGPDFATRVVDSIPLRSVADMNEPFDTLALVTTQFDALGIPYFVGGSIASILYGEYRATADIDVIADIQPQHVQPLVAALSSHFYIEAEDIRDALRSVAHARTMPQQRPSFNITDRSTFFRVDIFLPTGRPFERSEFSRRIHEVVGLDSGQRAYVATAEDMILAKLEWYEIGNRSSVKQWPDLLSIVKFQGEVLDLAYLRQWAQQLGVSALLEQLLTEAGIETGSA